MFAAVPATAWDAIHPQHRGRLPSRLGGAQARGHDLVDVCGEPHAGLGLRYQRAMRHKQLPDVVSEWHIRHSPHARCKGRHRR